MLVQRRRDTRAALRLMRKLLKKQGFAPKLLVTDTRNQPIWVWAKNRAAFVQLNTKLAI
jgi:transposase-like protein